MATLQTSLGSLGSASRKNKIDSQIQKSLGNKAVTKSKPQSSGSSYAGTYGQHAKSGSLNKQFQNKQASPVSAAPKKAAYDKNASFKAAVAKAKADKAAKAKLKSASRGNYGQSYIGTSR